ncbi:hypothetical protein BV22DRAFT_1197429 [Leucogyrophana mollusca]|uniref:Uncharacterized protein n=1 Tax=Leucogyrophana mollusca TaxID=85980 RepID=A0ACB8BC89_9AGAM|nr:hypothetical protein BV22DRAFT_1197429 [Leucogyrophana mollusca]
MDKAAKNQFIQSYIESQRAYAFSYASQGLHSTLGPADSPPDKDADKVLNEAFGFDTPVLKPRIVKSHSTVLKKGSRKKPPIAPVKPPDKARRLKQSAPKIDQENKSPARNSHSAEKPRALKKRPSPTPSDDEYTARLAERRERKRLKRAITGPQENDKCADLPLAVEEKAGPKPKEKKGKKPSTSASLALIHGFAATNVGKGRLTLQPPASVGVFNKGKASTKTRTATKSTPLGTNIFSEFSFLNRTPKRPPKKTPIVGSPLATSSPSSISISLPPRKKIRITNYKAPASDSEQHPDHDNHPDDNQGEESQEIKSPKSEIWDIELDSCPSSVGRPSGGKATEVPASIVLNVRDTGWLATNDATGHLSAILDDGSPPGNPYEGPDDHLDPLRQPDSPYAGHQHATGDPATCDGDHESSLHPWQSASQVGQHITRAHSPVPSAVVPVISKYFGRPQVITHQELHIPETDQDSTARLANGAAFVNAAPPEQAESFVQVNSEILAPQLPIDRPDVYPRRQTFQDLPFHLVRGSATNISFLHSGHEAVSEPPLPVTEGLFDPRRIEPDQYYHSPQSTAERNEYWGFAEEFVEGEAAYYTIGPEHHSSPHTFNRNFDLSPGEACFDDVESHQYVADCFEDFEDCEGEESYRTLGGHIEEPPGNDLDGDMFHEAIYDFEGEIWETCEDNITTQHHLAERSLPCSSLGSGPATMDNESPSSPQQFLQGRSLLRGVSGQAESCGYVRTLASNLLPAEADVAKNIRGHWRPQKL